MGNGITYLLLYVEYIILTASYSNLLKWFINTLSKEFAMSDLGPLYQFLGVEVTKKHGGFFLSQTTYANDILNLANMSD